MLKANQYKKILSLDTQGNSIRNIARLAGHSRNTIRKVLDCKSPPSFKVPYRPSKLDKYEYEVKSKFDEGVYTAKQIHESLIDNGFDGSYSSVRRYLSKLIKEKEKNNHRSSRTRRKNNEHHTKWLLNLSQGKISVDELETLFPKALDSESIRELYLYILKGALRYRKRSLTIFAHLKQIPQRLIAESLGMSRMTVRIYIEKFESGGNKKLFDFIRKAVKKHEEPKYREKIFQILHSPPSCYGFNRTTWRMEDLYQTMKKEGLPIAKPSIRSIIKKEGYRFIKARKVLTSNDPLYREKLEEITSILSNLKLNEKFFSVDEFGPIAIKIHGGRSWTSPGGQKIVPQWQESKGRLILTAALELSSNQVTHFYSEKKNTNEMIKLLDMILRQHKEEDHIFFSWDAASWHASKKIYEKVSEVNESHYRKTHNTPKVSLAPLPSSAQFLNVIESVFSGMARAIIHNSNYASVGECKSAIDKYFDERNHYFKKHPKRAGNKIWGKEITLGNLENLSPALK